MPEYFSSGDIDFGGGDGDWFGALANLGAPGDLGDFFLDTVTGDVVSADDIAGMGYNDVGDFGPVGEVEGPTNYDWNAASEGETGPGQATPEQIAATSPYNAGGGVDWSKALMSGLKGLSGLMSGEGSKGGLLKGLTDAGGGGGVSTTGLPGIMSAGIPQVGGVGAPDIARAVSNLSPPGVPGLDLTRPAAVPGADLMRAPSIPGLGMQDAVSAALMRLQAEGGGRVGLAQGVDVGPISDKFNPIVMPFGPVSGGTPQAQHLSGLQRLALERLG